MTDGTVVRLLADDLGHLFIIRSHGKALIDLHHAFLELFLQPFLPTE